MRALSGLPMRRNLFPRTAGIGLSQIKEMELRAAQIPGVVSLAQGIPSFDTPEPIGRYVQEKIASGACSRYSLTPGLPKLREAIAEALLREGMRYDPETEIIVTCGSIEAISATLLAAIEPGDEVIVPSPSYPSYVEAIRMAGGVPRFVPLREEQNYARDPEALAQAIGRRTAAILLANPNNPTGTVYSPTQIARLADLAERHDLLLVSDEVYKDFLYNDAELFTPARLESARARTVRVFSFSKAYGMTGWRVGFLHSDRSNVAEILKVHDALVTCAPVVSQYAALAALELGAEPVEIFRREFLERRNVTLGALDRLSDIFDYQKPNASYFVFPRVKDTVPLARDSRRLARDILERARVALVPGVAFGPSGEAHLRISYSRRRDEIEEAFARLTDYFQGRTPTARAAPSGDAERLPLAAAPQRAVSPPPWKRSTIFPRARRAAVAYLDWLARRYLERVRPRCVAIAGLQGKTVTKRWLREMLAPALRVRANLRSYNTDLGLPLAILDTAIDSSTLRGILAAIAGATARGLLAFEPVDVLILEMGLRRPGDARALLEAVTPDLLVLLPLTPSFSNDLSFLDAVEREVADLARRVSSRGGRVVACADDPRLASAVAGLAGVRAFGRDQAKRGPEALTLEVEGTSFEVALDVVGESSVYALLAGIEVAKLLGVGEASLRSFLAGEKKGSGVFSRG
ncbi:MAG: aminotransferase class I/II-fold pyridoxal phosphate-dependent enzyme [Deltaproteobacteria bacterium]|nr:aminotransferase class I/II-fold pyridoxal phosphate-dependent enzyme [Deltaproteobacteria bacterium]